MKNINGKVVLDDLSEVLDPSHTALIVIDMQNDFCDPDGLFAQSGMNVTSLQSLLPHLAKFARQARKADIMVLHTQNTTLPNGASDSPAWLKTKASACKDPEYTLDGSWGQAFCAGMEPLKNEAVIKKNRSSGFINTNLDLVLRSNGIKSIVVTGCLSDGCVLATANHARFLNYYVVVPGDCIGSTNQERHEAALTLLNPIDSSEVLKSWSSPETRQMNLTRPNAPGIMSRLSTQ